jgi:thioredoxin reductase
MVSVAIIGAGPYGLSIAAHLQALGVEFRIFGYPMDAWISQMPKGMRLKSEGFASSLFDPHSTFTLGSYCKENGIPYANAGIPVPLDVFASYGLEFQRRFVPKLEHKLVNSLERSPEGFRIRLDDGEMLSARRVVMATGIAQYAYIPPMLDAIPGEFVTHSSKHVTVDKFKGREVAVIGAGASAVDLAALLYQAGAQVELIARQPVIRFHDPPNKHGRSYLDRLRSPETGIGRGWRMYLLANAPLLFRQMPQAFRLDKVRRVLGPAPGWFTKDQVVGKVSLNLGLTITDVSVRNGRVNLQLVDGSGMQRIIGVDHVIAATGYKVDLRRLSFMDADLQSGIRSVEHTPVLSSNFESSVPGLYFVGVTAANTFGPLLRFAFGAGFTARRISKHLSRSAHRESGSTDSREIIESRDHEDVAVR